MEVGNTILKITHCLTIFFMMGEDVKLTIAHCLAIIFHDGY